MSRPSKRSVADDFARIKEAGKCQKTDEVNWHRWEKMYAKRPGGHYKTEPLITDNYVYSSVSRMTAFISSRNPTWITRQTPTTVQEEADMEKAILKHDWREFEAKNECELALLDGFVKGPGYVMLGWVFDEKTVSRVPERTPDDKYIEGEATQKPKISEVNYLIKNDKPFLKHIPAFDIRYDPYVYGTNSKPDDARVMYRRIIKPLELVKNKPMYSNTSSLEPTAIFGDTEEDAAMRYEAKNAIRDCVMLWEIWDRENMERRVIAEGHEFYLFKKPWPYNWLEGFPIRMLRLIELPGIFFPGSSVDQYEDHQRAINDLMNALTESAKRAVQKVLINANALTPEALKDLKENDVKQFILTKVDPKGASEPLRYDPGTIAEIINAIGVISGRLKEMSGVMDQQRGLVSKRQTATEANLVQSNTQMLYGNYQDKYEKFTSRVARGMLQLRKEFTTHEDMVKITGDKRGNIWLGRTKDDIQGEYFVEIAKASMNPPANEMLTLQQKIQILTISMQMHQAGLQVNIEEYYKRLMKALGEEDVEKLMVLTEEQQMKQLQQMMVASQAGGAGGGAQAPPASAGMPSLSGEAQGGATGGFQG